MQGLGRSTWRPATGCTYTTWTTSPPHAIVNRLVLAMHAMLWGIDRAAIFFAEADRPVPGRLSWLRNASLGPKRTEQPGHGGLQPNGPKLQGVLPIKLDAGPKGTAAAV